MREPSYVPYGAMLVALIAAAALPSAELPIIAGVVQTDGMLLPFAEYKDRSWKNTWATADAPAVTGWASSDNPAYRTTMLLSRVPSRWTGYPSDRLARWYLSAAARHNAPLHVNHAGMFPIHCGQTWGLATDLPKRPWRSFPIAKAGIAFTSPQDFHAMVAVPRKGSEFHALSQVIRSVFDPLDQEAARDYAGSRRSQVDIRASVTESPIQGQRWYYAEAQRTYRSERAVDPAAPCDLISFLTAWVEGAEPGSLKLITHRFFKTDCDMKEVSTEWPFGVLHLDNRDFLFSQINGYEDEAYRISAVGPEGIHSVLEASGGGC